ncbi:AMP-binding enzyme [Yinghuangia aomiensis]
MEFGWGRTRTTRGAGGRPAGHHIAGPDQPAVEPLHPGAGSSTCPRSGAQGWLAAVRRGRVTHALVVADGRWPASSPRSPAAPPTPRRCAASPTAGHGPAAGTGTRPRVVPGHRLRERLRPHRDRVVGRGARPRRPAAPRRASADPAVRDRLGIRRPGRCRASSSGSPPAEGTPAAVGETSGSIVVRPRRPGSPASTAAGTLLDPDGWFATRDLGRLDADGYLFIDGRAGGASSAAGRTCAPAEIEDVLLDHPGIREAAVIGVADPEWAQSLVAHVVVGDGDPKNSAAGSRTGCARPRPPTRIVFPTRTAQGRHRQAPAPRAAGRHPEDAPTPEAVIVEALRTPIGTAFKGTLPETDAFELARHVLAAAA